jgi:polyribonucleotide nucleotidyltransferase
VLVKKKTVQWYTVDYIQDEDDMDMHVQRISTSRPTIIEVKVPRDSVGAVIGRGGSTVKGIQEESNTRITFKDGCEYFCRHIW